MVFSGQTLPSSETEEARRISLHAPWVLIAIVVALYVALLGATSALAQSAIKIKKPQDNTVVLRDAKTGMALGSATNVCLALQQPKLYLLTAAHVIENAPAIKAEFYFLPGFEADAQVLLKDTQLDLAVITVDAPLTLFLAPCVRLAQRVKAPRAYDLDAESGLPVIPLAFESLDLKRDRIQRIEFNSPVAYSVANGLPGRNIPTPLLMVHAHGLPGVSGGMLLAEVDSDIKGDGRLIDTKQAAVDDANEREDNKNGYPGQLFRTGRRESIGIVLATDPKRNLMAILPAPVISARLFKWQKELTSVVTEASVPGGIRYLDSGAIHYRSERALTPSGTGRLADGGTGRLGDGGTGRLGDGGSGPLTQSNRGHGIWLKRFPERNWLSIGNIWSEGEAFPAESRTVLSNPTRLEGIFETREGLFATSAQVQFPEWLDLSQASAMPTPMGCKKIASTVHHASPGTAVGDEAYEALFCEPKDPTNKGFTLIFPKLASRDSAIAIKVDVEMRCAAPDSPCPINLTAEMSGPSRAVDRLERDGLREFRGPGTLFQVDRHGGFRLELTDTGSAPIVIAGPSIAKDGLTTFTLDFFKLPNSGAAKN